MLISKSAATRCKQRHLNDARPHFRRQLSVHDRKNVGAERIADEGDFRCVPARGIGIDHSTEVVRSLLW